MGGGRPYRGGDGGGGGGGEGVVAAGADGPLFAGWVGLRPGPGGVGLHPGATPQISPSQERTGNCNRT